jgi:hypothetical protein
MPEMPGPDLDTQLQDHLDRLVERGYDIKVHDFEFSVDYHRSAGLPIYTIRINAVAYPVVAEG